MKKKIFQSIIIISLITGSACTTMEPMQQTNKTIYSSLVNYEMYEVSHIIMTTGKELGWKMEQKSISIIEAEKTSGDAKAAIEIRYDRSSFKINYVSSENLDYDAAQGKINSTYNSWVSQLQQAITKRLNK